MARPAANRLNVKHINMLNKNTLLPLTPKPPDASFQEGLVLTIGNLWPGDFISCNQYMSTTKGRVAHMLGKEDKARQLVIGTIFIDHATNFIFYWHQTKLTSAESLGSKYALKALLSSHGTKSRHYSSNNHTFTSKEWISNCTNQHQVWSLSRVRAHRQNYINWSQQAQENLCPFAIDYSVYLWNTMSSRDQIVSLTELLTSTAFWNYHHLQQAHIFGCPVFVPNPRLQDSKTIQNGPWEAREASI